MPISLEKLKALGFESEDALRAELGALPTVQSEGQRQNSEQARAKPPKKADADADTEADVGMVHIPTRSFGQIKRAEREKGTKLLLKELGLASVEELKSKLAPPASDKGKDAPAAPKNAAQAAAAEVTPPKAGESQEEWLKRAKAVFDAEYGTQLKELKDQLDEQKSWREEREAAEQAAQAQAEHDESWKEFRTLAVKHFGIKQSRIREVEAYAQRILGELPDEVVEELNASPDGLKLWEEVCFDALKKDPEAAAYYFKSATQTETETPAAPPVPRRPANTGTRAGDERPADAASAAKAAAGGPAASTRDKVMNPKTSKAQVASEFARQFGRQAAGGQTQAPIKSMRRQMAEQQE
jgi:hypothetical protein